MTYAHFLLVGSMSLAPVVLYLRTSKKLRVDTPMSTLLPMVLPSLCMRLGLEMLLLLLDAFCGDAYRILWGVWPV